MAPVQQRYEENANRLRRQPEQFKVGDKVWLDLKNVITAVPDELTVELNVPGNIHKRFQVGLVKRAGKGPFPSQISDDAQYPPVIDELGEEEHAIESILRAKTIRHGRGKYREALAKWESEIDPS
ncbi:hypothetical protein EV44_g3785 [Erysiphe necator]|uniref:Uncharacterized protein n=1 Tax=Uncinula necator TaxID=52586 RepID=A0A0B1PCT2_UNCNE|nr:hypothetical protein EV44_g3785 [Erysiphe necator]